jgi:hypothetical protein
MISGEEEIQRRPYWKISQFIANVEASELRQELHEDIVLSAMIGAKRVSKDRIVARIAEEHGLRMPYVLVSPAVDRLVESNRIQQVGGSYQLPEEEKRKLLLRIESRMDQLASIENSWIELMQDMERIPVEATEDELRLLKDDLRQCCIQLLEVRGEQLASFLAGQYSEVVLSIDRPRLLSTIPTDRPKHIHEIEADIFPRFFIEPDEARMRYVQLLAQGHLRKSILNVEAAGHRILDESLKDISIYLDTNIVFGLFGLFKTKWADEIKEATERLIEINRVLGIEQHVSLATVEEFLRCRDTAAYNRFAVRPPDDISVLDDPDVGVPDDPFTLAFWRQLPPDAPSTMKQRELERRWENFMQQFISVGDILELKHGIRVDRDDYYEIRKDPELPWLVRAVHNAEKEDFPKTDAAATHDAIDYLLIKRRREGTESELLPASVWLITYDSTLDKFDRIAREETRSEVAYSILGDAWLTMITPLLPVKIVRDLDPQTAAAALMSASFMHVGKMIPPEQFHAILALVPEAPENTTLMMRMTGQRLYRDSLSRLFQEKPKPSKGDLNNLIKQYLHEVRDYYRKSMIYAAEAEERQEEYVAQLAEQEEVIAAQREELERRDTQLASLESRISEVIREQERVQQELEDQAKEAKQRREEQRLRTQRLMVLSLMGLGMLICVFLIWFIFKELIIWNALMILFMVSGGVCYSPRNRNRKICSAGLYALGLLVPSALLAQKVGTIGWLIPMAYEVLILVAGLTGVFDRLFPPETSMEELESSDS